MEWFDTMNMEVIVARLLFRVPCEPRRWWERIIRSSSHRLIEHRLVYKPNEDRYWIVTLRDNEEVNRVPTKNNLVRSIDIINGMWTRYETLLTDTLITYERWQLDDEHQMIYDRLKQLSDQRERVIARKEPMTTVTKPNKKKPFLGLFLGDVTTREE